MGGSTGVETDNEAASFSRDGRCRSEWPEGLLGDAGTSSLPPFATTASIGRRGRLYKMLRLRDGSVVSESAVSVLRILDLVGDRSSDLCFVLLDDGEGEREDDPHGLRARFTIRPDMERFLDGRAAGSGALVSGTLEAALCDSVSLKSSDDDSVKCETCGLFLDRRDVRRRMSFPAATLSLDVDLARVGTA